MTNLLPDMWLNIIRFVSSIQTLELASPKVDEIQDDVLQEQVEPLPWQATGIVKQQYLGSTRKALDASLLCDSLFLSFCGCFGYLCRNGYEILVTTKW